MTTTTEIRTRLTPKRQAMATVKEQLKGTKVRTTKQDGTTFEGWGAYAGRSVELIDPNRNGHAVFEPVGLREDVFLRLDSTVELRPTEI
ncbi:MAG: hypothetical protein ACT4OM_13475 [Actinomycetota bacterium]